MENFRPALDSTGIATPSWPALERRRDLSSTLRNGVHTPQRHLARLLAVLALLSLLPGLGCAKQDNEAPLAKYGVLDLSEWSAVRDGPIALNGQWEFYWQRLLTPEDFRQDATPPEPSGFLSFPGLWGGYDLHGRTLSNTGWATFRLRILPGPGVREWGIRLFSIPAAFRLWANGELIAKNGVVGETAKDEIPARSLILADLSSEERPLDLILQISNHVFRRGGGVHYPIMLAQPGQLQDMHMRVWCWAMLFVGGLLSMSIYHFLLYFLRKQDTSTLYVGLYALVLPLMYATMDSSEWLSNLAFPNADSMTVNAIGLFCYVLGNTIFYRFCRSIFPDAFPVGIQYFCDAKALAFLFIILFFEHNFVYNVFPAFAFISLSINLYIVVRLGVCVKRGYDSALILLCGCLFLAATAVGEIFYHLLGTTPDTFFPMGCSAFILSQAFALALRFSKAFSTVENMSRTMDASNIALRAEMEERNRLEREIIKVSEEERRRISHELHDGLCQRLGGIRLRCGVLEMSPLEDRDVAAKIAEISSLLEDSVGQAYDLSRGLWPVEHADLNAGPSLEELARCVSESSGVTIDYVEDLACESCQNEHLVQLYRIAQEAVTNAVKHANPSRVVISLECRENQRLRLVVRDDGAGRAAKPPPEKGGLGLYIMHYRARVIGAEFTITDAKPSGTVVTCSLPCEKDGEPA